MKTSSHYATVTIEVEIYDPEAFVAAAVKRAIAEGADEQDARKTYTADDLNACAQMLLDPGVGPPGSSIIESSVE